MEGGVEEVRRVVAAHCQVESVVPIGEGLENWAYEVNGDLIVRFSKDPDPGRTEKEARLLATVAAVSPLPVPAPLFIVPQRGCLAYRKLRGTPLVDVARSDHDRTVASALGGFLAALHAIPVDVVAELVDIDDQPTTEWLREAAALYESVATRIPPRHRAKVESCLDIQPPQHTYVRVFSHNDLGIEHVLVDPEWTVTGVIDWSDAALVDPAYDFGLLYRDLGPDALHAALDAYGADPDVGERAAFYARCSLIEDLAYGIETGRSIFVEKSLTALSWLSAKE